MAHDTSAVKNPNVAVYAEGCMYPGAAQPPVAKTIAALQGSGFTTLILSLFHIGRDYDIQPPQIMGDLYCNDTLVISQGKYVGDPTWPGLVATIVGGSVQRVVVSVGGGGVLDFQTIQRIYQKNGNSFQGTNLMASFQVLRQVFPSVSAIDMDCEETYDQSSFVAFCQMLAGIGFKITFCPWTAQSFWTSALAALHASNPGAVIWWNLQCYDGGSGNNPATWASAIRQAVPGFDTNRFLVAGDWTNDGPQQVQALMSSFAREASVGGGFMWTLDAMIAGSTMKAYATAIHNGLAG